MSRARCVLGLPLCSFHQHCKSVCKVEVGRHLPCCAWTPLRFQGNTKHDKGWQSKTLNCSYRCQKQDSPTANYRTGRDPWGLLLTSFSLFHFSRQQMASLLWGGFFGHYSAQFFSNAPQVSPRAKTASNLLLTVRDVEQTFTFECWCLSFYLFFALNTLIQQSEIAKMEFPQLIFEVLLFKEPWW